jgi:hypothetical protein
VERQSRVSVLVIDWTETGAPPPMATLPIWICLLTRRLFSKIGPLLSSCRCVVIFIFHFETVYSAFILKDLQVISNYPNPLRQVLFDDWAATFSGGPRLQ